MSEQTHTQLPEYLVDLYHQEIEHNYNVGAMREILCAIFSLLIVIAAGICIYIKLVFIEFED